MFPSLVFSVSLMLAPFYAQARAEDHAGFWKAFLISLHGFCNRPHVVRVLAFRFGLNFFKPGAGYSLSSIGMSIVLVLIMISVYLVSPGCCNEYAGSIGDRPGV